MKKSPKKIGVIVSFALVLSLLFCPAAYAYQGTSGSAIIPVTQGAISGGVEIEMTGTIAPTIMSVTMPSYIAFDITKSTDNANKVLSPDVEIKNNSYREVSVYASTTYTDLSEMPGVVYAVGPSGSAIYSSHGAITVGANEIAVGMSSQGITEGAISVDGLDTAFWLMEYEESGPLAYVPGNGSAVVHVVGTLGNDVPENCSFRIMPTLIATYW